MPSAGDCADCHGIDTVIETFIQPGGRSCFVCTDCGHRQPLPPTPTQMRSSMSIPEQTPRWHQTPWGRAVKWALILLVLVVVLYSLSFAVMGIGGNTAGAATACRPITKPANVKLGLSERKYRDTIKCGSKPVKRQLIKLFGVRSTSVRSIGPRFLPGCHGSVTRTVYTYIRGTSIKTSWRKVTQNGWCWNNTRITTANPGVFSHWAAGGFCWSEQQDSNVWWSPYWERKIFSTGTVRSCFFHVPQASYTSKIYYQAGGSANVGGGR